MKKIISIDAETNGLWGQAFQIGAVLQEEDGTTAEWCGRCPIDGNVNEWVRENVLPMVLVDNNQRDFLSYENMLQSFMEWYLQHKSGAEIIVHVGCPVESKLFIDAHNLGYIGDWDAPFPLIDVSAHKEIGTSVDAYNKANGIKVPNEYGQHHALYDAWATLLAWNNINKN